jgi:glutathione S-transferase
MLEETGAAYQTELLDYGTTMKEGDYLAINPMGKVPAITHQGRAVTEAAAICAYLAEAFPEAGLAPTEDERADYFRWMFFAAGPVEQAITNRSVFGSEPTDEQQRTIGYGTYDRVVDVLDGALTGRDYICGDRFTGADVYVGSTVDWGLQFGTLPTRPSFEAYASRLRQRPAYKRAKEIDQALMPK